MRKTFTALLAGVMLVASAPQTASAQVTVGSVSGGNCYPFSCINNDGLDRYQQLYSASAFSATPITFNTLTFFNSWYGGTLRNGNYNIRFNTVSTPIGGLSSNAAANLGAGSQSFFVGFIGNGAMSITGSAYTYDPSMGNLLMDVTASGQTDGYGYYLDADYSGTVTSRSYGTSSYMYTHNSGLVTQFSNENSQVTPEPISMTLLGTGLAGVAAARRRKKAAAQA